MLPAKKMTGNASTRASLMVKPSGTISLVIFVFMIPTSPTDYSHGFPSFTTHKTFDTKGSFFNIRVMTIPIAQADKTQSQQAHIVGM